MKIKCETHRELTQTPVDFYHWLQLGSTLRLTGKSQLKDKVIPVIHHLVELQIHLNSTIKANLEQIHYHSEVEDVQPRLCKGHKFLCLTTKTTADRTQNSINLQKANFQADQVIWSVNEVINIQIAFGIKKSFHS